MKFIELIIIISTIFWSYITFANVSVLSGDCSGTLFKMPGMNVHQKALILTNGHCIGFGKACEGHCPDSGELFIDHQVNGNVIVHKDNTEINEHVGYKKVLFATMTGVDIAIIELDVNYLSLQKKGYKIYSLARELPTLNMMLQFKSYNRNILSKCVVDKAVSFLKEDIWIWNNSYRMKADSQCQFIHGQSGTAGIASNNEFIYALAQTGYLGDNEPCSWDSPCELNPLTGNINMAEKGQGYAVPVALLYECYNKNSKKFNFNLSSCHINFRRH